MDIPWALAAGITQSIELYQMFYDAIPALEVQQKQFSPTNLLP
jgi:hypothetical protein